MVTATQIRSRLFNGDISLAEVGQECVEARVDAHFIQRDITPRMARELCARVSVAPGGAFTAGSAPWHGVDLSWTPDPQPLLSRWKGSFVTPAGVVRVVHEVCRAGWLSLRTDIGPERTLILRGLTCAAEARALLESAVAVICLHAGGTEWT